MTKTKKLTTKINKELKYFPIKTDTACKLKWTWSALYLDRGQSSACHRTAFYPLTIENFNNFHNNPLVLSDRQQMLEGKWPDESCSYCRNIESKGGMSDRLHMLSQPGLVPYELDENSSAIVVTPRVLEIFISNVCNMSCLYCGGDLSSKINLENKKHGPFNKNGVLLHEIPVSNANTKNLINSTILWLKENSRYLDRLHFLGGEPFFQKEFDIFLDFLSESHNPNLEINVITNLMVSEKKLKNYLDIFKNLISKKKIKRLDITCSIDCWGKESEYVRNGLDLSIWEKNFNILLDIPWLVLHINQTISCLSVKTTPMLISKLLEWRKKKKVGHHFATVNVAPSYMHPAILGPDEFSDDFDDVLKMMPTDDAEDLVRLEYMQGIVKHYKNSQVNTQEITKLITYLDEIDRRRNLNWQNTFPWLVKYKEYVVQ